MAGRFFYTKIISVEKLFSEKERNMRKIDFNKDGSYKRIDVADDYFF